MSHPLSSMVHFLFRQFDNRAPGEIPSACNLLSVVVVGVRLKLIFWS